MKTEVILTSNIIGLGGESDQVKVAAGYARNYLFPQRLAIPLTHANKRRIEALKQRRAEREAHEFNTMSELAKGVTKLICVIKVKTGEDGKLVRGIETADVESGVGLGITEPLGFLQAISEGQPLLMHAGDKGSMNGYQAVLHLAWETEWHL